MIDHRKLKREIPGALSLAEIDALADIAEESNPELALEVGHYLGLSTAVLLNALPADCDLHTVDHHRGDKWTPATDVADFYRNIEPYARGQQRGLLVITGNMESAIYNLVGGYDFVFYDADHNAPSVERFWEATAERLADRCTLVFDDADWIEQATLRKLAERWGFVSIRTRAFYRRPRGKSDDLTYTLEVMRRSA